MGDTNVLGVSTKGMNGAPLGMILVLIGAIDRTR